MLRGDSPLLTYVVAALVAVAVLFTVIENLPGDPAGGLRLADEALAAGSPEKPRAPAAAMPRNWAATAPGKVEPRHGEVRISSQVQGRIVGVLVKLNDLVRSGDLMIRLDDEEAGVRLRAAAAKADAAKRLRDDDNVGQLAADRRKADDGVHEARRQLRRAREDLDAEASLLRRGSGSLENLELARIGATAAEEVLATARERLRQARSASDVPLETEKESAVSAARAQEALADVALEYRQIRAPVDGTIMEVEAKVGETAAPSPRSVLLRIGDLTGLRVRAEIEERDVGNVRNGQAVVVRSKAFPGKAMTGRVTSLAPRLGPNKIAAKGPRRPTDLDVLEALVVLDGMPPLLPGMRVDVYFKPISAAMPQPAAKVTN